MSRENPDIDPVIAPVPATTVYTNNGTAALPDGTLIAWYGDDFTGAAAVMEVLAFAGLPAMLFLEAPTQEQLARYPGLRAVGIASTARAQSPDWMSAELPAALKTLQALKPELVHYKICTTLDSSPQTGSIGRAIEIGAEVFSPQTVPILVAAPQMQRYQIFGHLFASMGDQIYRIDRHPVMARHPVTPMNESDVARHIERQSERVAISNLSYESLEPDAGLSRAADLLNDDGGFGTFAISDDAQNEKITAHTLDCWDNASEVKAGRMLWENRKQNRFVVGSQGVEFALVKHWQDTGLLPKADSPSGIGRSSGMVTVSGSVSPTTAAQIAWSKDNGFMCITFEAAAVCGEQAELEREQQRVVHAAIAALASGKDPLIYTATGPEDPAVARFNEAVTRSGADKKTMNQKVGETLGWILREVLQETRVTRAVVSGGDTSGYATRQLGIFALSALAPTITGASIFKAHAQNAFDGLEIALKGGQMGTPDYFGWIRDGGGAR